MILSSESPHLFITRSLFQWDNNSIHHHWTSEWLILTSLFQGWGARVLHQLTRRNSFWIQPMWFHLYRNFEQVVVTFTPAWKVRNRYLTHLILVYPKFQRTWGNLCLCLEVKVNHFILHIENRQLTGFYVRDHREGTSFWFLCCLTWSYSAHKPIEVDTWKTLKYKAQRH